MQELRHPRPVVHRIIVPEERLATELTGNALQMTRRELARTDLFAGPEGIDLRVKQSAEIFEIVLRSPAKDAIENRIIGVIGRADQNLPRRCALGNPVYDVRLRFRQFRNVAAHVVEQYREDLQPEVIQTAEFGCQKALRLVIKGEIDFIGAEAEAEAHAEMAAVVGQPG